MQTVTDEYIAAMRLGSRTDRITGTIALTDGTVIDVTDEILVNGNLSIDERCMNSFDIGTFYTNQMKLAIYDSEALLHEFANARVELRYGLLVGEEYEEVFLGKYTVDGTNCKRVRDRVYLTAYDRSAKFDRTKSEQAAATAMPPYNALQLICSECSVVLATTQAEIEAMPNGTLSIKCDSSRIETMRDCVMWIAGLLGGYARINREGKLEIRKAKYSVSADDQSQIIIDRTLNGKERISTSFSDTRIYPKYMEAYCAGKAKVYTSSYVSTDVQARAGSFSLPENPLISSLSEEKQNAANKAVLAYLDSFKQRTIKTTIYGDPALECGDTVKLTGGSIDVGRNIVGVVTRYTWKFRQQSTIQCVAPAAGEITAESDVSTFSVESVSEEAAEGAFVMPRAQSEKKSSGVAVVSTEKFTSFSANADGTYTYNGVTYGFETDEGTGYINKVYDDERTVDIDTENAAVNVGKVDFNTLVMAVAISNGLNAVDTTQLMLYDSGNERVGITGGWELNIVTGGSYYGGYVTAGKSGGLLYGEITASSVRSGTKHMGNVSYTTINRIPLKGYSKVCAEGEWYIAKANDGTRDGDLLLTLFSNKPTSSTPASVVSAKYRRRTDDSEFGTARNMVYEFDISDMDDSHYISVNIWGTAWLGAATSWGPAAINSYFKVSKIWLEK